MRIVFIGAPGAGKGTQCGRLARHLGVPHLSTGEMLRDNLYQATQVGTLAGAYVENGQLVPDPVILQMIGERLEMPDCQGGYLLDGFPRTLVQAASLDDALAGRATPLDAVLLLEVDEKEIVRRLSSRGRADDTPDTIRQRLDVYRERTKPLINYYRQQGLLRVVSGVGSPDEVFERVTSLIEPLHDRSN